MPVYDVTLGTDVETDQKIKIGDIERRSGLYILGRPGSGKTTLIKKLIEQDMEHGHGVFFLDPHGTAIDDLLQRIPSKRQKDVILLDPTEETQCLSQFCAATNASITCGAEK
jgi:DNA helicase HerA-like ATPase